MSEKQDKSSANFEDFEMLKALYDFQAVYPKTISFDEGEYFILHQTSARQRNWWQVISMKGYIGFVPSNYVMKLKVEPNFLLSFLDSSIESLEQSKEKEINGIISKDELIQRLKEKKKFLQEFIEVPKLEQKSEISNNNSFANNSQHKKLESNKKSVSSPSVCTGVPQMIQESPSLGILCTKLNNIPDNTVTPEQSETTTTPTTTSEDAITFSKNDTITDKNLVKNDSLQLTKVNQNMNISENNISKIANGHIEKISIGAGDVYEVVDNIRRNTNLSYEMSCEALRVVIVNLEKLFPNSITDYLNSVAVHVNDNLEIPAEFLGSTHDSKRLQYIFTQLADCKNDSEQRTWMLYEDEDDIVQFLEELVDILRNADENISCYEMSCDHYQSLVNLVQYYQMETRWPIKKLLLKAFTAACQLDHIIVDILLTSVLPLEIIEDMKNNVNNVEKMKDFAKMLTVIFSMGQQMPVNHQEHLGAGFITFLIDIVEGNYPEALIDIIITLVLAFNLQFTESNQNFIIEAMQKLTSAKIFTEKILLYLNREEDPVKAFRHTSNNTNSVLKIFVDLFSLPETASLFYTNDNKVLIDILVRQLSDLSPGDHLRRQYLELCRRILRNTDYAEHTHRKQDLMKIFTRIFCEETECSAMDQQLVREIANEFSQIFKA